MGLKYNKFLDKNFTVFNKAFVSNKFTFIHIPKNASSSMRRALKTKSIRKDFSTRQNKTNNITCIIIRDPITRIVSSFFEVIKLKTGGPYWETNNCQWFKIYQQNPKKNIKKSFKLFLDYIEKRLYHSPLHKQISYLKGKKISLEDIDYVWIFDRLNKDFKEMCEKEKLPLRLRQLNKTQKPGLTSTLIEIIRTDTHIKNQIKSIYSEDFILYDKACKLRNKSRGT